MRFPQIIGCACASLLLAACAGSGNETGSAVTGSCNDGQCTGVCVDEVKSYARDKLGSEATDVTFSFASDSGSDASTGVAYFRTEACTTGQYQAEFYGNSQSCSETYRGRLPNNVGKLLVVPDGCKGV
jgi:hypothetical protein